MLSLIGLTISDVLMLVTLAMIVASAWSIMRRVGSRSGNGNGYIAGDAERISGAWRALVQEQRKEIEIRDAQILLLMEQLSRARIEPVTRAQAETIYEMAKEIREEFSLNEIDTLALSAGVRPDDVGGETIDDRARELVLIADRRSTLPALMRAIREARP